MTLDNTQVDHRVVTRRTVLVVGAGGAGAALLAACGSGGSDDSSTSAPSSDPTSAPESSASAPGSSAPESSADSSTGSGAGSADSLTALDKITVGEAVAVTLPDGKPGLVTRTGASTAVCFSAICTHKRCTVKPDGKQLACPCHGSTFEAATGKVTGGPAPSPLPKVSVKVVDGQVVPG